MCVGAPGSVAFSTLFPPLGHIFDMKKRMKIQSLDYTRYVLARLIERAFPWDTKVAAQEAAKARLPREAYFDMTHNLW